jgi:hypothetical protein
LAALCHHYPGYTLASLREVTWFELTALVDTMKEMNEEV